MKISPVASPGHTVGAVGSGAADIRTITMSPNVTPGAHPAQVEELPRPLNNPDTNKQDGHEETRPLSPQFAALAKQRRALQQERQAFEREKAERAATSQGATVDLARLKAEPLSVLLESGVTYDQLTQAILADQNGNSSQLRQLEAKIKALEEGVDQKLTAREAQAERQVYAEMQREASQLATRAEFELVRESRSVPKVMDLIKQVWKTEGQVMDVHEAMTLVENELIKDALKLANLEKVRGQIMPVQPAQPQQRPMRTLTNRDTASVPLSAKQRAVAAFYGQLRK